MVDFFTNVILGISLAAPLGPVTLEIIKRGISKGLRDALLTTAGTFAAEFTYFLFVILGLSFLKNITWLNLVLGFLGFVFLSWLGYDNLKKFFLFKQNGNGTVVGNPFVVGFMITFFNPVNFFMWVGIIAASFVQNPSLIVASGVLLGVLVSYLFLSFFSSFVRKKLGNNIIRPIYLIAGLFMLYYAFKVLHELFKII